MTYRLIGFATALLFGSASLVSAQSYSVLTVSSTDNGSVLGCQNVFPCSAAGTQGSCEGSEICWEVNASLGVCLPTSRPIVFEAFCCDSVDDCPLRDGAEAQRCAAAIGDIRVCQYSGVLSRVYSLCHEVFASPAAAIQACYAPGTSPDARQSLAAGDCDGDGQVNSQDVTPCTSRFIPPSDAGVDEDASTIIPLIDQGGWDQAGFDSGLDAGGGTTTPVTFQGGGGCHVGARPDGSTRGSASLLALLGLAVLAGRRRCR